MLYQKQAMFFEDNKYCADRIADLKIFRELFSLILGSMYAIKIMPLLVFATPNSTQQLLMLQLHSTIKNQGR